MGERAGRFWKRVNDYGKDETRDPFSHSGAYHRHFQGYAEQRVPRKNGKGTRIERVYVADYCRYDETDAVWRWKKLLYAILFILAAGSVILAGSRPAAVNRIPAVGIAQILSFLPLIWLAYHLILQVTAPRRMTIGERDSVTSGFQKAALISGAVLLAVAVGMTVEARIVFRALAGSDWSAIGLMLAGSVLALLLCFLERVRKLVKVPNETPAPAEANEIW